MPNRNDQLKRLDALFDSQRKRVNNNISSNSNGEITIIDNKTSAKCEVHRKRRDSIDSNRSCSVANLYNRKNSLLSVHSNSNNNHNYNNSARNYYNKSNKTGDIKNHNNYSSSITSLYTSKDNLNRRQSFTEGFGHSAYDRNRKRNSWNVNMLKSIEHPSAFPSLLRSDTSKSTTDINNRNVDSVSSSLSLYGSINSNNYSNNAIGSRRTGNGTTNLNRRSSMSALSVNRTNTNRPKATMSNTMLNKKSFGGSSLYLRPDSSGTTNLVRRDSIGTRSISNSNLLTGLDSLSSNRRGGSVTRDYVSDRTSSVFSPTPTSPPAPPPSSTATVQPAKSPSPISLSALTCNRKSPSILRRSSVDYDNIHKGDKLTKENLTRHVRILENLEDPINNDNYGRSSSPASTLCKSRRYSSNSSTDDLSTTRSRRMSIDSLDWRRSSIDLAENDLSKLTLKSSSSSPSSKEKTENEHHLHHHLHHQHEHEHDSDRPQFVAVTTLEDTQAVRCAEFHPSGNVYAVGSNSKTFRICEYPSLSQVREDHMTYQPTVLFKRTKHHKGSIYCIAWAPDGELIATGSNDKTIKLMRYDDVNKQLEGREIELTMHDGTVRDICFLEDTSNKSSLLISGGAGDCKIYVTDCATATPFQSLSGHGGSILSLYNWGGAMFVSGSHDKTVRFWDLRTRGCVNTITPATTAGSRQGSPVAAVCVDPSGRLLVSGHEDSSCVLYDIRGNRPIQCFKYHTADLRSIRFSPSAYYLLTGGYDHRLALTDLQGDLTLPLPSVFVANHKDKVISGRWHPKDFSFVSTSADKTATLWALPPA